MTPRHAHPVVYLLLILPFGVIGGFLQVSIGYLLAQSGVPVDRVAALIAVSYLPHTWKFLWAPIADTTLRRRTWYVIGCLLSAAGIFASGASVAKRWDEPFQPARLKPRLASGRPSLHCFTPFA
jgi:hypothetical protein